MTRQALLVLASPSPASRIRSVIPAVGQLRAELDTIDLIDWDAYFVGYEPEIREAIGRYLPNGAAAVDVGANIGLHTLAMARATGTGKVIACEPNPSAYGRLVENVALNQLTNVLIRNVAVTDRDGPLKFYIPADPRHAGGASLQAGMHEHLRGAQEIEVLGLSLDMVAEEAGDVVRLVKIDVEGLEGAVLRSGYNLLREQGPALLFEYTRDWWKSVGYELEEVLGELKELGYRDFRAVTWRGLRPLSAPPPHRLNLLALKGQSP